MKNDGVRATWPDWDASAADPAQRCREQIAQVIEHPAWDGLAALAQVSLPMDFRDRLNVLAHLSTTQWDFRRGGERKNLDKLQELEPSYREPVLGAAQTFGMCDDTVPKRTQFDAVLVLGGLARACFARTQYAQSLLADRAIVAPVVAALTGERRLTEGEKPLVGKTGVDSEAGAMRQGLFRAFGLHDCVDGLDRRVPRCEVYRAHEGPELHVVIAELQAVIERARIAETPTSTGLRPRRGRRGCCS